MDRPHKNETMENRDMKKKLIGFDEALKITLDNISAIESETVSLADCSDRVVTEDLLALVNSPSVNASLKEGYAVRSEEIAHATPEKPVHLKLIDVSSAGNPCDGIVTKGTAVRVLTGAKVPEGATAVVAEEFTASDDNGVTVKNDAKPGRNILPKGSDVAVDDLICSKGDRLVPGMIGILAAAGHHIIPVYRRVKVAIIATGDEVVVPGKPLPEGKLYASNMATLNSWCRRYGMETTLDVVKDDPETILSALQKAVHSQDAVLTSGGAWTSDRDYVAHMLESLGWRQFFHRTRMGPGKAVGFGTFEGKPVFILPGGPPSNLLAFLEIGLPGLLKLGGYKTPKLPEMKVKLGETVTARESNWTQFIFGHFRAGDQHTIFEPLKLKSRLQSMAMAQGVIAIPEGVHEISKGSIVPAQILV
jgi:molybdopterin molybdotransferase